MAEGVKTSEVARALPKGVPVGALRPCDLVAAT
jgi:hypothetical protein